MQGLGPLATLAVLAMFLSAAQACTSFAFFHLCLTRSMPHAPELPGVENPDN